MCIGNMWFCLEKTGKIQIEYIDIFSHIFEIEASQLDIICELILRDPL